MPADRNRRHIQVRAEALVEDYAPPAFRRGRSRGFQSPENRAAHAERLLSNLRQIEEEASSRVPQTSVLVAGTRRGIYVQFESREGVELNLDSLENRQQGIELLSATGSVDENVQRATVFVPEGKLATFLRKLQRYAFDADEGSDSPRHKDLLDRIAALRSASLRALWTDSPDEYPSPDEYIWWEVWLRRLGNRGELDSGVADRFAEYADQVGIEIGPDRIEFGQRVVILARATPEQLSSSIEVLGDLAEVRRARAVGQAPDDQPHTVPQQAIDALIARTVFPGQDAPAVCIIDTGVQREHPLLQSSLSPNDMHTVKPAWGTGDPHGHGTEMAGLALYGDLGIVLNAQSPIVLRSRLESVKLYNEGDLNQPQLYGAITAEATGRVEVSAPQRQRIFSMAIASSDQSDLDKGEPTSWSAAVDALVAGRMFGTSDHGLTYIDDETATTPRIFVVSAGNVSQYAGENYLDRCDLEPILDPGQAWNAITVGAFTEKVVIRHHDYAGWSTVAPAGELSPFSRTSVGFARRWPIKPDVVFEGGNLALSPNGTIDFGLDLTDISLLTTYYNHVARFFTASRATSAATAQVAGMASVIAAEYPSLLPESIRALLVHSAEWTTVMQARFDGANTRGAKEALLRRYGFGVPSLARSLRSAADSLTLINEGIIHPFQDGKMREIAFHQLPWPTEALEGLGEQQVRLRLTLSYFIEPNPGRRGWSQRYRYPSHGLRFEVIHPTESLTEFRKRINDKARGEEEERPQVSSDSTEWYLGEDVRSRGSLHSDFWNGTAAELARRNVVGIYPVTGWWKDNKKFDRSDLGVRYSLIMSIETSAVDVDIWTPVAVQVGVPIEVVT